MKTIITLFVFAATYLVAAAPSTEEIGRETDSELIDSLTNNESSVRCASLTVLGLRFNDPEALVIMSAIWWQTPHSKGVALPKTLLGTTVSLAKNDSDLRVRLAAVMALEMFKYRTNTTPILNSLLEDPTCIIRIRAAQGLIDFADDYHEPISEKVVSALIGCLNTNNSPDDIWQAEETLGYLGAQAKEALPLLAKLKHSKSPEVQEYAKEAIRKIHKGIDQAKNESCEPTIAPVMS
jgi:HEAT repeat protein